MSASNKRVCSITNPPSPLLSPYPTDVLKLSLPVFTEKNLWYLLPTVSINLFSGLFWVNFKWKEQNSGDCVALRGTLSALISTSCHRNCQFWNLFWQLVLTNLTRLYQKKIIQKCFPFFKKFSISFRRGKKPLATSFGLNGNGMERWTGCDSNL